MADNNNQQPNAVAVSRMQHLISMRDCLNHATLANNQELNQLYQQRTLLINLLRDLGNTNPFTVDTANALDICSGTLSRVEARISELEKQAAVGQNLAGRIRALYLCHLVAAPILQVSDVETAQMARELQQNYGWAGTACMEANMDPDALNDIIAALGPNVPWRTFVNLMGQQHFNNVNNNNE